MEKEFVDKPAKRTFKKWIEIELTGTSNEELRKDIYEFINYNNDKYSLDDVLTYRQFEDILFENGFIGMGHPRWKKPLTEKAVKKTMKEWIDSEMTDEVKEDVYEFINGSDKYYLDDVLTYNQFEKIMFKNGFDDQGWMWKPLTECECSGDCGGVNSKAFAGQLPENMSKMIQIKKYVESESNRVLDGYTKNKVWPPKIKPKFDINSSRFRESEKLARFIESISSDVKEFLKNNPNAKPGDFIKANPNRSLSYQGLVTAFYNARKELGITATKGRGRAGIETPRKPETLGKARSEVKDTIQKPGQSNLDRASYIREISMKGIDQAKLIVQGDCTEKELINRLLNTGYDEKYLKVIKDKASYDYYYVRWKSGLVEEGHLQNGSGASMAIESMKDRDSVWVEKSLATIRQLCKGKDVEIVTKDRFTYEVNLDKYQTPKNLKDIKSAYDFVRFMTDEETRDLRKTIPWEDKIDTLMKFFAGKTIKGTWHDYEWGSTPYFIKFTPRDYTFSKGRDAYAKVSWFGVKNKGSEEYEEFQECSPWSYLRDIMENNGKDCFKPDVIMHDMSA